MTIRAFKGHHDSQIVLKFWDEDSMVPNGPLFYITPEEAMIILGHIEEIKKFVIGD